MKIKTEEELYSAESKWQEMKDRLFDEDFTNEEVEAFGELGAAIYAYNQGYRS